MKKLIKILLWTVVIVVGGALLLLLTSPLWLGPLAASIANGVTPGITGTPFKVAKISINPFSGKLDVEELHLGNPEGYDAKDAFSVGKLSVDIAPFALLSNRLHIENIDIIDPYVSYLGEDGTNNFDAIIANVNQKFGSKEEEKPEEEKPEEVKDEKEKLKVSIARFHLEGVKFKMGVMPEIPIPIPITLTDLGTKDAEGKETDGVTPEEMGAELSQKLSDAFSKAGVGLANLFNAEALKGVGDSVSNAAGAASESIKNASSAATKSIGEATKSIGDATKGAGDAAKKMGSGVSDAASSATDAAGKAAGAVGDAASKAADTATEAVKNVGEGAKNLLKGAGGLFGGNKD